MAIPRGDKSEQSMRHRSIRDNPAVKSGVIRRTGKAAGTGAAGDDETATPLDMPKGPVGVCGPSGEYVKYRSGGPSSLEDVMTAFGVLVDKVKHVRGAGDINATIRAKEAAIAAYLAGYDRDLAYDLLAYGFNVLELVDPLTTTPRLPRASDVAIADTLIKKYDATKAAGQTVSPNDYQAVIELLYRLLSPWAFSAESTPKPKQIAALRHSYTAAKREAEKRAARVPEWATQELEYDDVLGIRQGNIPPPEEGDIDDHDRVRMAAMSIAQNIAKRRRREVSQQNDRRIALLDETTKELAAHYGVSPSDPRIKSAVSGLTSGEIDPRMMKQIAGLKPTRSNPIVKALPPTRSNIDEPNRMVLYLDSSMASAESKFYTLEAREADFRALMAEIRRINVKFFGDEVLPMRITKSQYTFDSIIYAASEERRKAIEIALLEIPIASGRYRQTDENGVRQEYVWHIHDFVMYCLVKICDPELRRRIVEFYSYDEGEDKISRFPLYLVVKKGIDECIGYINNLDLMKLPMLKDGLFQSELQNPTGDRHVRQYVKLMENVAEIWSALPRSMVNDLEHTDLRGYSRGEMSPAEAEEAAARLAAAEQEKATAAANLRHMLDLLDDLAVIPS